MTEPLVIAVTRHFAATQEQVFDAWLDPESARHWLFATDGGEIVRAQIDPHVGGRFLIVDRRDGVDVEHHGTYVVIDRPRQLEFEFVAGDPEGESSRVIVHVIATESGCELTLTHVMDPKWAEFRERTIHGWTSILAGLARTVEPPH